MLKPTLTMVLDRKTVNTTRELMSRLRKALKMELQAGRHMLRIKAVQSLCLNKSVIFSLEHEPTQLKHTGPVTQGDLLLCDGNSVCEPQSDLDFSKAAQMCVPSIFIMEDDSD